MIDRTCRYCGGQGKVLVNGAPRTCPQCLGSGQQPVVPRMPDYVPKPLDPYKWWETLIGHEPYNLGRQSKGKWLT